MFFRLSGFHDEALGSLLRHRLLLLSEPIGSRVDVGSARQIGVDLPVGDKMDPLGSVQSRFSGNPFSVPPPPTNYKPKSKKKQKKKVSSKAGISGSSYNKDGEVLDAGWVKVMKNYQATKKARVKDTKADNAAKTDGASAAPQDSGE